MTLDDIKKEVEKIKLLGNSDSEAAHSEEDELYLCVLKQVIAGHPQAVEMAKTAITTQSFYFSRWCA